VVSSHPFLDVNTTRWNAHLFKVFRLRAGLDFGLAEVGLEMLKKSYLFRDFLRVVLKAVLRGDILLFCSCDLLSFVVVKVCAVLFNYNFSTVVKENPARVIRQNVTKPILAGVINPLLNPYSLRVCRLGCLNFFVRTIFSFGRRCKCDLCHRLCSTHWSLGII
jgi:hypothetical protein